MSDKMRGIPFQTLLKSMLSEYRSDNSLYYVPAYSQTSTSNCFVAGRRVSAPVGPAAGPHTQLAQNLLAGFVAGARIFELKTVQIMEGEELGIVKPCIYVDDEAYNTEWSSELTVQEATEEYTKAYLAIHLLAKEFGLDNSFQFHISVGYDLKGIKSKKIDTFLDSMLDASTTEFWNTCLKDAEGCLPLMQHVNSSFIYNINPCISNLVTLSTMHGCPADEIEKIATYLIEDKKFNTYIKCNPTLIGFEKVSTLLKALGYGYMSFDTNHFDHDMGLNDAVAMIERLLKCSSSHGLVFGVKLTNTFPVQIKNGELSGDAMYMSGKPLFALAIHVANTLVKAVKPHLPISFSGGIDAHNIADVLSCGITPVTVATVLLKAGGYKNLSRLVAMIPADIPERIDSKRLEHLCDSVLNDAYYQKPKPRKKPVQRTDAPPTCFKCKNCVDVCPNRANFPLPEIKATIHIDSYCNECGNCACLCPCGYIPYRDKFTFFHTLEDFENSQNDGFVSNDVVRWKGTVTRDFAVLPATVRQAVDAFLLKEEHL